MELVLELFTTLSKGRGPSTRVSRSGTFGREAAVTDAGDIVIRKLTNADVQTTAEVLASAFADNAAYVWMHPRAALRASDLRAFFERNLRWHSALDLTWVATRGPQIVGTTTLEPPGGVRSGLREAVAHWLVPTVRDQGLRTFLRTAAADREFGERYRALIQGTRYYHLHAVAVAPGCQGNGVGSKLVATTLEECERLVARDPAPVVLSTQRERNLPFYRRLGFVLKEDHQMGVRWGSRGFRTWFMIRDR
jgi:GNAT superfamily N-acetyltransferase